MLIDRRQFLATCAAVGAGLRSSSFAGAQEVGQLDLGDGFVVRRREEWAGSLDALGALPAEEPRVLLVHHTVNSNDYRPEDVPGLLRGVYGLHTGPEKGWPDVAYNFFVDRYGGVWEGRKGSLDGPVRGDATGGNQGYSQLCCFVGDHSYEAPTTEASAAMTHLLALLGERYDIDTSPGATTSFTSLGSNRWPAGQLITTRTIAGHRDMSSTACPGDAAYPLVTDVFPEQVTAIRLGRALASASTTTIEVPLAATSTTGLMASQEYSAGSGAGPTAESPWLARVLVAGGIGGLALLGAIAIRLRRPS